MMQVDNKQILLLAPIRFNEIFYCESQTELGGECVCFLFLLEIRILSLFFSNGCCVAVSWTYGDIFWKRKDIVFQATDEAVVVTSREVCAAYFVVEETISGKKDTFFLAVETYASRCVPRSGDNVQCVCTKSDGFASIEDSSNRRLYDR